MYQCCVLVSALQLVSLQLRTGWRKLRFYHELAKMCVAVNIVFCDVRLQNYGAANFMPFS